MILEDIVRDYNLHEYFRREFIAHGYTYKQIEVLNSKIESLNKIKHQLSNEKLNELLIRKTNLRLFKGIDQGENNLIAIINYPELWVLCDINVARNEYLNPDALIFSTERQTFVFTKNQAFKGLHHVNNKWQ